MEPPGPRVREVPILARGGRGHPSRWETTKTSSGHLFGPGYSLGTTKCISHLISVLVCISVIYTNVFAYTCTKNEVHRMIAVIVDVEPYSPVPFG